MTSVLSSVPLVILSDIRYHYAPMNTTITQGGLGAEALRRLEAGENIDAENLRLLAHLLRHVLGSLHTEESLPSVRFREAAAARMQAAAHRRPHTRKDLQSYINRFLRLASFAEEPLNRIRTEACRSLLEEHFGYSPFVYRKAHSALHSIFSYGRRKRWCEYNPTEGIDLPPVREETLTPLTLSQIRALLRACSGGKIRRMNAAVRLMLWCGIRPTEVQRLRWGDIDRSERCIYVEPHASKTGGARAVPLRGGALALLQERHPDAELIAPRDWQRLWCALRHRAKLLPWRQDTLRHTFASMHLKHFHNLSLLQEEMGHSSLQLLRTRYLNLRGISTADAAQFFRMRE